MPHDRKWSAFSFFLVVMQNGAVDLSDQIDEVMREIKAGE